MPRQSKGKRAIHRYETMTELLAASEAPRVAGAGDSSERKTTNRNDPFYGTALNYGEMLTLAREGWAEMRPMVDRIANKVQPQLREMDRATVRWTHDVVGAVPCVPRVIAGHPQAMRRPLRRAVAAHGRVVTVLVDVSVSCSVSTDQIAARGAAVVALIETLHELGHTCALWVEDSARSDTVGKGDLTVNLIRVKAPEDRIDGDELMFTMAHPSMLRRLLFKVRETRDGWESFAGRFGYGYPNQSLTCVDEVGADVAINTIRYQDPAVTDPAIWVINALKGLGLWEDK